MLPCLIKETDKEIIEETKRQKKENKSVEQYIQSLAGGQTVGTPENLIEGLNKYVDIGVTHFILHFIGLDEKALLSRLRWSHTNYSCFGASIDGCLTIVNDSVCRW